MTVNGIIAAEVRLDLALFVSGKSTVVLVGSVPNLNAARALLLSSNEVTFVDSTVLPLNVNGVVLPGAEDDFIDSMVLPPSVKGVVVPGAVLLVVATGTDDDKNDLNDELLVLLLVTPNVGLDILGVGDESKGSVFAVTDVNELIESAGLVELLAVDGLSSFSLSAVRAKVNPALFAPVRVGFTSLLVIVNGPLVVKFCDVVEAGMLNVNGPAATALTFTGWVAQSGALFDIDDVSILRF